MYDSFNIALPPLVYACVRWMMSMVCKWSIHPWLDFHQLFIVPGYRKHCKHVILTSPPVPFVPPYLAWRNVAAADVREIGMEGGRREIKIYICTSDTLIFPTISQTGNRTRVVSVIDQSVSTRPLNLLSFISSNIFWKPRIKYRSFLSTEAC